MFWLFLACTVENPSKIEGKPDSSEESRLDSETGNDDSAAQSPCGKGMVQVASFCIDQYESKIRGWSPYEVPTDGGKAESVEGEVPQGYISGAQAQAACEAAGKRLCTSEEWLRACQGPEGNTYPYGNSYDATGCNTSRAEHPVVSYWGNDPNMWDSEHMNDPGINQQEDTVDPAGANPKCKTSEDVFDMHGNLHEWVAEADGTFRGGFYADASINGNGCLYKTTAHDFEYHDYSTGFRCCGELGG